MVWNFMQTNECLSWIMKKVNVFLCRTTRSHGSWLLHDERSHDHSNSASKLAIRWILWQQLWIPRLKSRPPPATFSWILSLKIQILQYFRKFSTFGMGINILRKGKEIKRDTQVAQGNSTTAVDRFFFTNFYFYLILRFVESDAAVLYRTVIKQHHRSKDRSVLKPQSATHHNYI